MQSSVPEFSREKLGEWQRHQTLLGVFLAVGGGTYCSMRARVKHLARHLVSLQGESANIALWINDARFEYGPVEMFLSPTPPGRQVTGISIYLKKADGLSSSNSLPANNPGLLAGMNPSCDRSSRQRKKRKLRVFRFRETFS